MRIATALMFFSLSCVTVFGQSTAQVNGNVKDQSGAVLPGVEVALTQTDTGARRTALTDETGSYTVTNLPIGPYRLEASLPGFRTYVQTGIVLQVNSNPTINAVMEVGQVSDQIEVQADAALVETRSTGVGTVVDNQRVIEMPLNGRNATELIFLSGMANVGTGTSTSLNTPRNYPTVVVSVAGGTGNGIAYQLDGVNHNDTQNSLNLPLPFPDALQEFKVETSALAAQYGYHANASVNAVTKSGANDFHGGAFEFLRNGALNARNFFAPKRDTLRRNQFGGVIGGPIQRNKLFFFGGYQGTIQKSDPGQSIAYIPTAAMLAGDFTAIASPACNVGRQITLPAAQGFTNNQISPARFNPVSLKIVSLLPQTTDPCGRVTFGLKADQSEHVAVTKIDYTKSDKHSMYARFLVANLNVPTTYDGKNALTVNTVETKDRIYSLAIGDTYLIGNGVVSSFRAGLNQTAILRPPDNFLSWSDLGVQNFAPIGGKTARLSVTGNGFAIGSGNSVPVLEYTGPNTNFAEDISLVRGAHQIGFGLNYLHTMQDFDSGLNAPGQITVNGQVTTMPLADFLLGSASAWGQGAAAIYFYRQNYIGIYGQDSWKVNSRLTVNFGLRWEPYLAPYSKNQQYGHFDRSLFDQGVKSTVYPNAPAGMIFPGDAQYTAGNRPERNNYLKYEPRVGLVWDPSGNGRMTIRAAFGTFTTRQHLGSGYFAFAQNPPWGNLINLTNVTISDPWASYAGGNPFPFVLSKNTLFPQFGSYRTDPFDYKPVSLNQWNLSIQRQLAADWLITANYVGNSTIHLVSSVQQNPAVFLPGASTTANTNQRRVLFLQNPTEGRYYGGVNTLDDGGTASYNGLLLSIQKRLSGGTSVLANYTWSHCISDYYEAQVGTGAAQGLAGQRHLLRGNCNTGDQRQVFNMSAVLQTPQFANTTLRLLASDWQFSPIMKIRSAQFFSVTLGVDAALNGQPTQYPNLVGNPYPSNQSIDGWLDRTAFQTPAPGTLGNLAPNSLKGPGTFQFDLGVSRTFTIGEGKTLQLRGEAFNLPNHFTPSTPVSALNSGTFGKIQSDISGTSGLSAGNQRIIQLALKYVF